MTAGRRRGFVLFVVLAILPLVALAMVVLSATARTMDYETTTALLNARARNLTAGAVAWVEHNRDAVPVDPNQPRALDTVGWEMPNAVCRVECRPGQAASSQFCITVRCAQGRQSVERQTMVALPVATDNPETGSQAALRRSDTER